MKRSEMLKTLDSAIKNMTNTCLDNRELEYILTQLERKGMLPPINNEKSFKMLENGEMVYQVNEWDPEND